MSSSSSSSSASSSSSHTSNRTRLNARVGAGVAGIVCTRVNRCPTSARHGRRCCRTVGSAACCLGRSQGPLGPSWSSLGALRELFGGRVDLGSLIYRHIRKNTRIRWGPGLRWIVVVVAAAATATSSSSRCPRSLDRVSVGSTDPPETLQENPKRPPHARL